MNPNTRLLNNYAIALNIPKFPEESADRFKYFLCQSLKKCDSEITVENIKIPMKEGMSQGIAFIKCANASAARTLVETGDFSPIDKKNKIRLISGDQYQAFLNDSPNNKMKPTLLEVPAPPATPNHFSWFLADPRLFDQIVYLVQSLPHAVWFNHTNASLEDVSMPTHLQSCEDIMFSPDGSFLVAKTQDKLSFYCGEDWLQFSIIEYPKLTNYFYSPTGLYMILQAKHETKDNKNAPTGATVFNMQLSRTLQRFAVDNPPEMPGPGGKVVPNNKINRIEFGYNDTIIYQSDKLEAFYPPDFKYETAKKVEQTFDIFSSCKSGPVLFTFRGQVGAAPPTVKFFNTETMECINTGPKYNSTDAQCVWHPNLPVCAIILTNKDRKILCFYDLTDPANVLSYKDDEIKASVVSCAWDPSIKDLKLAAIIESHNMKQIRTYQLGKNFVSATKFATSGTQIQFSPSGRFATVDDIQNGSVIVQFYDMENGLIKSVEMNGVESLQWDPSGVFVLAYSSRSSNSGFSIYLLDGNKVLIKKIQSFKKCIWRNRLKYQFEPNAEDPVPKELFESTLAKYGRFGAVDEKLLEEEKKQTRLGLMRDWLKFQDSNNSYKPPTTHKTNEVEVTIKIPNDL